MATLTTFADFIRRVEELGFLPMTDFLRGYPSMRTEVPPKSWHTGLESDPWLWKDRAAEEKRLAYGCILGGKKGFVSAQMYPVFYAAYHPAEPMPERWAAGTLKQVTWRLWNLFEEEGTIDTHQARKLMQAGEKKDAARVDATLVELQRDYYITVSGNMQKVSAAGNLYGWPSIRYTRVADWLPEAWAAELHSWQRDEAREAILDAVAAFSQSLSRKAVGRALGF